MNSPENYIRTIGLIDLDKALEGVGGMMDCYMDILKVYYETGDDIKANINKHFESKSYYDLRVEVHGLKSSSYVIGAVELGDFAKKLEFCCRDIENDTNVETQADVIEREIPELLKKYDELLEKLTPIFSDTAAASGAGTASASGTAGVLANNSLDETGFNADAFREKAEQAIQALAEYDLNRLDEIISEIAAMPLNPAQSKAVNEIQSAIMTFDYALVESKLKSL